MPGHQLIEYGELEGRPAVVIDAADIDLSDETSLLRLVVASRGPGTACVVLEGKVPWGTHELDRQLLLLGADGRTEDIPVWCVRDANADGWASIPLWWVIDCSAMFQIGSAAGIVNAINLLPYIPSPVEALVRDPHPDSVAHAALDELATRLDPGLSWLYFGPDTPPDLLDLAHREVARAATPWGVRRYA